MIYSHPCLCSCRITGPLEKFPSRCLRCLGSQSDGNAKPIFVLIQSAWDNSFYCVNFQLNIHLSRWQSASFSSWLVCGMALDRRRYDTRRDDARRDAWNIEDDGITLKFPPIIMIWQIYGVSGSCILRKSFSKDEGEVENDDIEWNWSFKGYYGKRKTC